VTSLIAGEVMAKCTTSTCHMHNTSTSRDRRRSQVSKIWTERY